MPFENNIQGNGFVLWNQRYIHYNEHTTLYDYKLFAAGKCKRKKNNNEKLW